ncbi:glycosyltransferase family 4 protein [Algimonas porphyrae]|uniref:GDP-mannose-dependent alpha-mannosyltransferase n=1 Tax=Algimonas porphyrae TaxID=1128113 RepID=A0ABQ5V158_9PROT|nr:glycosyltransferase family 1 protein [Algimonas porphyrae]GLQ20414.1 GDP-mannose-dependent alpha-mannosyltransferase [Algimonas porphyrae]
MKILLITDAWHPQMNGVVRTLDTTVTILRDRGHKVEVIAPSDGYWTMPLPTYPDIRLAPFAKRDVERRMVRFGPEAVHIATEGPLGQAARALCLRWGMPFTTSYHTKFPEYIKARVPFIPMALTYKFVRDFHNSGGRTMVTTPSMAEFLETKGFTGLGVWARGVDTTTFHPDKRACSGEDGQGRETDVYHDLARPIFVNVGRVAVEKNIEAFLDLDLPGSKVVVGDGPQMDALKKRYPDIRFTGAKFGDDLARHFADADVFVFPSKTDTFGLVIIEAMATGTPVAAYPVSGPIDIVPGSGAGVLDDDLRTACLAALDLSRDDTRAHAENYGWDKATDIFFGHLTPEYEPLARKRWRRVRRLAKIASSPAHILRRETRRIWRILRGKSVPDTHFEPTLTQGPDIES